jgi:hypothetical protein
MYIDPGSGSLILQVLGAALIAVLASFSSAKQWVKGLVHRVTRRGKAD